LRCLPPPGAPGSVDIREGCATPERSLPSTMLWSHDTRCSSGSGRGKASSGLPKGWFGPRRSSEDGPPLAGETSAGESDAGVRGFGLAPRQTTLPVLGEQGMVSGCASARGSRPARRKGGSQAVGAAVLADWVGCRGRRAAFGPWSRGHGSSPTARTPRGGRARRANRRRKPDRGGESRQHASSETGGGLLVIPRAVAKAFGATGGGSTRTTEGVLVRRERRL